ncbi:GrpB family protein [Mesorhizobium sp. 1B3]|uniref:GrpB family protein n=1 Tax=Mesorhizobium sp. 1B3 TaxID=3243599 RepID=UPI003D9837A3
MDCEEIFGLALDDHRARHMAEQLFDEVKRELSSNLPSDAQVLHVGATSIPGCLTKGDLDIVVRVDASEFAAAETYLASRFSRNESSARSHEFAAFEDPDRAPPLGVQLTAKGGSFDIFHTFAEALRANAVLLRRYNALKLAFQNKPMAQYRAAKGAFINEVLQSVLDHENSR